MRRVARIRASMIPGSVAAWPADVAPKDKLGAAMGIYRVVGDVGLFLGPITVTYLIGVGGEDRITWLPFIVAAALVSVIGLAMIRADDPAAARKNWEEPALTNTLQDG